MAAGDISITLKGSLKSAPASCNGVGSTSSGPTFQLALKSSNAAAAQEESSMVRPIDSVAPAFEDLGIPASMAARVFYLRVQTLSPFVVRLTTELAGVTTLPSLSGSILFEFAADDRLTTIEVQGQGTIEWYAAGDTV